MKNSLIIFLGVASAISIERPFKIGDEVVEFDEEEAFVEEKPAPGFDELAAADADALKDFDKMLASADRNADKGELNIEMAKAQVSQLVQSLKTVDENLVQESTLVKKLKSHDKE